ncbi:hypothetical protein CLIM01_06261 [Colletotrichum limetticola]|uniref:LEM3 family/CDC50 family protein n=1 Tax=Colletotrichum limetticola TaxID=1209924 RepID=A0ABQ9PXX0_9PEZI|nr:hypothetical protein CLIM01_06261 [Colletotrichum limetticola]
MGWFKSGDSTQLEKPRKPKATPFNQQRLKAWKPLLTPKSSIKIFLALGVVCLSLGVFWLVQNVKIREMRIDYTKCDEIESFNELEVMPPDNVRKRFKASSAGQPVDQWKRSNQSVTFDGVTKNYTLCTIEFFLPEDLQPPVLYYYRLTNFHQNHRLYVNSRHKDQLKGEAVSLNSIKSSNCAPVASRNVAGSAEENIVYPCGMIANSYFNDTFANPLRIPIGTNRTVPYNMTSVGIAKSVEKGLYQPSKYQVPVTAQSNDSVIVPPPGWAERYPNGYHSGNMFNPAEDESFMVWMRTSAASSFSKMAMRNKDEVMERGIYRLDVISHYPVRENRGTKSIIISTTSGIGRRNSFLGRSYLAMGTISMFFAFISALTLRYRPRRLADHDYLHRYNFQSLQREGSNGPMLRATSR